MKIEFDNKEAFLKKLSELEPSKIKNIIVPHYIHELERFKPPAKKMKFITAIGAITGLFSGLLITTLTSLHWNLIVSGKQPVEILSYIVVIYELTILFGSLTAFVVYILFSRDKVLTENKFVIILSD
ncbi:MAG: DUF3341 domain-containing protein [bacterium]|nr:DUF3341 domain-containing protein [bacterium]